MYRKRRLLSILEKHEYNICTKAGSSLGRKHSDKTKQKISDAITGFKHSDKSKQIMSDAKKRENNPNFGKPRAEGAGKPSQSIEVFDLQEKTTTSYNSMSEAARALNINLTVIVKYFANNQQKPYKGRYTFKKVN
jgi:group I intron endonuclease